jgi:beta-phosphoglucomutase-like phosphatase (HAD superfamily)
LWDNVRVRPRAVLFDFNGTLSDDEPILCAIDARAVRGARPPAHGARLPRRATGLSDEEICTIRLGAEYPGIDRLVQERIARLPGARDQWHDGLLGGALRRALRGGARADRDRVGRRSAKAAGCG